MNTTNKLQTIAAVLSSKPTSFVAGDLVIANDGMVNNMTHLQYGHIYCVATMPIESTEASRYESAAEESKLPVIMLVDLENSRNSWHADGMSAAVMFEVQAHRVRLATQAEVMRYNDYVEQIAECIAKRDALIKNFQELAKPFSMPVRPTGTV